MIRKLLNEETRKTAVRYILALIATVIVGSVLIKVQHVQPGEAFRLIFNGAFGSAAAWGSTLRYTMPCILLSTAAAVAFKSGVFNLGLEGQMYVGALLAAWIGYTYQLPAGIHAIVCILAAGLAGIIWAIIPALLKLFFDVSEMVVTLMMNYIALLGTEYIVRWIILGGKTDNVFIETPPVNETARLATLIRGTSSSTGLFIAVFVAIAVYVLFKHTYAGYELKQVGENIKFSKAGGINVKRVYISIFLISSLISGMTGAIETIGPYRKFSAGFAGNIAWEGIMISFISGHNPIAIIFVSFIWSALKAGALGLERYTPIGKMTVYIIQMLFVCFVAVDYAMLWEKIKKLFAKRPLQKVGDVK